MTIKLNSITKNFGELVVISNVTLEVRDGELFVLLGGSGSGKSTILRIIAGLVNPDSGAIFLNGRDATDWAPQRRGCGMVFQHYAIFKHMNVGENVEFGLRVRNVPSAERRRRRDEMLELVGLSGLAGRMPLQLSGGQRQRVALARALAFEPSVLLLDEPFGALDVKIRSQLRSMLRKVQSELGVTTILVTHDQEEAFELGDRIGILERGQLVEVGDPQALYHGPATETAATFLGSGNLVVGRIEGGKIRMGKLLLPFPAGGPAHEEGGPVRVLFRPEAIEISDKEFSSQEAVVSLGESALVDRTFAGPLDRMRFEVATLQGSRPLKPSLHYGQRFPLVEVIKRSAAAHKSLPGDKVFLGISQYHILNPSGVRMLVVIDANNPESAASRIADVILLASHGIATLVAVVESTERRQECLARLNAVLAGMRSRTSSQIDLRIRVGQPTREIILEVQEQFYDFVIIAGANLASSEESAFEPIIRRLLVYSRIPVMLGMEAPPDLKKLMICTAAGAPGKGDIKLGGRLARHTQAISTVFHVLAKDAGEPWKQAVDRHMAQAQALLEAYGVRGETKVREGEWQKEIAQEAERENFDLILLGTSAGMNYGIADYGIELCLRTKKCVLLVPPEDVL